MEILTQSAYDRIKEEQILFRQCNESPCWGLWINVIDWDEHLETFHIRKIRGYVVSAKTFVQRDDLIKDTRENAVKRALDNFTNYPGNCTWDVQEEIITEA